MELLKRIAHARGAHERLRSEPRRIKTDADSLAACQKIRGALEALWPASKDAEQGAHIRQAIRRLIADAELQAGVSDAEAFRDTAAVWQEYDFLERVFTEASQH